MMNKNYSAAEKEYCLELKGLIKQMEFLEESMEMNMEILRQKRYEIEDELSYLYYCKMLDEEPETQFEDYDDLATQLNKVIRERSSVDFQLDHTVETCEENVFVTNTNPDWVDETPIFSCKTIRDMCAEESLEKAADFIIARVEPFIHM